MNELQIQTIDLSPAKIEFNKEQVINELKGILSKYEGLVFTEENTTDIRKTLAGLRKGRKIADDYRKDIKKQLTAPVTAFEKEMKEITALFDEVIYPINEELKAYEARRKEEKRQLIQSFIDETIEKYELESKFASKVTLLDSFLNKTASDTQTKESIEFMAQNALNEQEIEKANKENIETFVKLKNAEHGLNLSIVSYLSQLEFKSVEGVKKTILDDVNKEMERKEKQLQEIERKAELEKEKIKKEIVEEVNVIDEVEDEPVENTITEDYTVFATAEQHAALEDFMEINNIRYFKESEMPF